jgi:hypothetical protein
MNYYLLALKAPLSLLFVLFVSDFATSCVISEVLWSLEVGLEVGVLYADGKKEAAYAVQQENR